MKFSEEMLRLYAVTDDRWALERSLLEQVEEAICGGASCVQLREKKLDYEAFLARAQQMKALCHRYGVPLIINDNVELAVACGADGVHVGQDDMQARDIRAMTGRDFIIGVTAKTVDQALAAQQAGADYLGSGAVFGSTTKLNTKPMAMDVLRQICASVSIPVVAIGGIDRSNMMQLQGSGVRGAAVVSGIFAARDIRSECRLLRDMAEKIIN